MTASTVTDAKGLVHLAERMGIPTNDAVGRLVLELLDAHSLPAGDVSLDAPDQPAAARRAL